MEGCWSCFEVSLLGNTHPVPYSVVSVCVWAPAHTAVIRQRGLCVLQSLTVSFLQCTLGELLPKCILELQLLSWQCAVVLYDYTVLYMITFISSVFVGFIHIFVGWWLMRSCITGLANEITAGFVLFFHPCYPLKLVTAINTGSVHLLW